MQRLLMLLLTVLAGVLPSAAHAWWQPDWQYRKQITVEREVAGVQAHQQRLSLIHI